MINIITQFKTVGPIGYNYRGLLVFEHWSLANVRTLPKFILASVNQFR